MFKLFLNAIEIALSKDVRDVASSLLDMFRASPTWKDDICTISAVIGREERERAALLSDVVTEKLRNLNYPEQNVERFRVAYRELVDNAFEHGCRSSKRGRVTIIIDTSPSFASFVVRNEKSSFDLDAMLEAKRSQLAYSREGASGRGLIVAQECLHAMEAVEGGRAVKGVVYRRPFVASVIEYAPGLILLTTIDVDHPYFPAWLEKCRRDHPACSFILELGTPPEDRDFATMDDSMEHFASSTLFRPVILINRILENEAKGRNSIQGALNTLRRLVLVAPRRVAERLLKYLPEELVFCDRSSAIETLKSPAG